MPPRAAIAAQRLVGVAGEVGDAERLVRVDEVQAVVRDPRAVGAPETLAVPMSRPR